MQLRMSDRKIIPLLWKKADGSAGSAQNITATSSDETVATGEVKALPDGSGDGLWITPKGPGAATFTVEGDTDPGEGEIKVSNVFSAEIMPEHANHLEFGEAVDQPPPA